jgi:hypothetical protein
MRFHGWRWTILGVFFTLVGLASLAAVGGESGTIRLNLRIAKNSEASAEPGLATVRLTPAGTAPGQPEASAAEPRVWEAEAPGSLTLELPPRSLWRIEAEAEGYWAAEEVLVTPEAGAEAEAAVTLWPTGRLHATLRVPHGEEPPEELETRFTPTRFPLRPLEGSGARPEGIVRCPVGARGELGCELPRGRHDLRLRAAGYAAVYRWDVPVEPRGRGELGTIELVPGGSVVGFLEVEGGSIDDPSLWVELAPLSGPVPGPGVRSQLRVMTRSAIPDPRGFFQFDALAPGAYRLLAGGDGYAPAELAPIRVIEGRESTLEEPLLLRPPAVFDLRITPPTDTGGEPWRVLLWPQQAPAGSLPESKRGTAGPDGRWVAEDLTPGRYLLSIENPRGETWHQEEIEVEAGAPPMGVELPLVAVRGRVLRGGEPVRALLIFGTERGKQRVRILSGFDGTFEGVLPGEGRYPLRVSFRRDGPVQTLEPVTVRRREGEEAAELEILIPDTRAAGVVVDRSGRPVPGARVQAFWLDAEEPSPGPATATSDEEGRFELEGLAEGRYRFRARRPDPGSPLGYDASSPPVEREIRDGRETPEVRLVLEGQRRLSLRVVGPRGPVLGARVSLRPETPDPVRLEALLNLVVGPSGELEAAVPDAAVAVTVLVLPPGLTARWLRLPLPPEGASLEIAVGDVGGTLIADLRRAGESQLGQGLGAYRPPLLHHAGTWVALPNLDSWAVIEPDGPRWVLSDLEPGEYALCPGVFLDQRCTSGYLAPGGELVLGLIPPPS